MPLTVSTAIAIQGLATASIIALTTIAPLVAADLGVPPQWIGYQISLAYVAAAPMSIVAGEVVRRLGPARTSQLGLLAGAVGLAGLATGSVAVGVLASLTIGLGYALPNPAASEILFRITPGHMRNMIFSLKQTGVPLGGIFVGLAMPGLALAFGWSWALLTLAAMMIALTVGLQGARAGWDGKRQAGRWQRAGWLEGLKVVWRRPGLRAIALMGPLFSAMQLSLTSFLVVMLVGEYAWSPVAAGALAAAIQCFGVAGRLFWGFVADRTGRGLSVLAVVGLVTSLCAAALPVAGGVSSVLLVAVLCVFGATSIGWNGVMMAEAARLSPTEHVASVAGGVLTVTFTGVVLGPALFALAFELLRSYAATYALFAALPLIGGALVWAGHRSEAALTHRA